MTGVFRIWGAWLDKRNCVSVARDKNGEETWALFTFYQDIYDGVCLEPNDNGVYWSFIEINPDDFELDGKQYERREIRFS